MYLATMRIANFRGLGEARIHWHQGLNVLVGPNNTGKTAILDSLRLCLGIGLTGEASSFTEMTTTFRQTEKRRPKSSSI